MIQLYAYRLDFLTKTIPPLLTAIEEKDFSFKETPHQWSKKEIIGHLIDSAANNHQRFVRGQFEEDPEIRYDQNKWNEFSFHQHIPSEQLIAFWTSYNKQLSEIIKRIPDESLAREVKIGDSNLTLGFIIMDYVEHLEHHLRQVVVY